VRWKRMGNMVLQNPRFWVYPCSSHFGIIRVHPSNPRHPRSRILVLSVKIRSIHVTCAAMHCDALSLSK
jgi:hypothetical protein